MARRWKESEHPRDSQGQFIEVGSHVTAAGGAFEGIVTHIERGATTSGGPLIHFQEKRATYPQRGGRMVSTDAGQAVVLRPDQITVVPGSGDVGSPSWAQRISDAIGRGRTRHHAKPDGGPGEASWDAGMGAPDYSPDDGVTRRIPGWDHRYGR